MEKQNTSVSHIQLWVAGLQSALVNSIRTFQFTPKNLCPQFTPLLWIWIIRCLYGISIWRSHQSQSEMWFKPTRKLFIPLVFSISGNNSTIHLVRQDRTLGVSYTLIFPSHRLCLINHQILSIMPPKYISCIHLLLSISSATNFLGSSYHLFSPTFTQCIHWHRMP